MKNINILKDLKALNKLHTSSVESYTTNNGIVDFTCDNNGYVDNVTIKGKTLVNLANCDNLKLGGQSSIVGNRYKCVTSASNRYSDFWTSYSMLKPNTTYTVTYNIIQNTLPTGVRAIAITHEHAKTPHAFNEAVAVNGGVTGIFTTKLTTKDSFTDVAYGLRSFVDNSTMGDGYIVELEIVLIEGDYTNTPISYFEGLKSVGQGDNIEVLTYNKTNNLIEDTFTYTKDVAINYINGEFRNVIGHYACDNYIEIEPSTDYMFVGINANRAYYDENKQVVPPINNSYLQILLDKTNGSKKNFAVEKSPPNARYIKITIHKDNLVNGRAYLYKSSNYDHKQISTTLRSLPNGVKDTIEKRGNKYVKVQRCGEVILNGNESDDKIIEGVPTATTYRFGFILSNLAENPPDAICVSDKFPSECNNNWASDKEQVDQDRGSVNIRILRTKLVDGTKASIKNWLKSNPITIVYQLAIPQIIELPNFNPQTYKGNNTLLLNSGVIQCDASFDVCEGIRSELDVIKNKVSSLDCDYVEDIELQFLNGWSKNTNGYYSAKMINGVACINLLCSGGIGTAGTSICYIKDQKFRPKINVPIIIGTNDGLYVNAFIQVTGKIVIDRLDIPTNAWTSICVSYPIL